MEKREIQLENDRLRVTVSRNAYSGQRFDNTGIMTQVILKEPDGTETELCTVESLIPGTGCGGLGLATEFDIDGSPCYDQAAVGAPFLKIGVGWLNKPQEPLYDFKNTYEVLDPGQTEVSFGSDWWEMSWDSGVHGGYGCRYVKQIRLADNEIHVQYRLVNTGTKTLVTEEYAHNFVAADCLKDGGTGYEVWVSDPALNVRYQDRFVSKTDFPSYLKLEGEELAQLRGWTVKRLTDGARFSEQVDFRPCKLAVWAMPHVISFELFTRQTILPGQTACWRRSYRADRIDLTDKTIPS